MKKIIILGKEKPAKLGVVEDEKGERKELLYQPFATKTTQSGVSRKHATITIDDHGCWWLEDRWSTNGTYIREDDGGFRKVGDKDYPGKCKITPMTFVKLGIDDTTCSCFYAKQAEKYGDFDEEFEYLQTKYEELAKTEIKYKKTIKLHSFLIDYFLPLVFMVILILVGKPVAEKAGGFVATLAGGLGFGLAMMISRMIKSFYGPQDRKKEIERRTKDMKKAFAQCPNPECNHLLSDSDIELMKCGTCNIKHN